MSVPTLNPARVPHFGALKDTDDRFSMKIQQFRAVTVMNDQQKPAKAFEASNIALTHYGTPWHEEELTS